MSQEYSAFISGSYTRDGRSEGFGNARVFLDADSDGYIKVTRTFTTGDVTMVVDDVAAVGHVYVRNHDATNALLLGADGANYPVRVASGDQTLVGWNGTEVHAKAESGTCYAEVMLMEGVVPVIPQQLYATRAGLVTNSALYTVDPVTGAATSIGLIGFAVTGLAIDPLTGILYGSTSNNSASNPKSLITIDTATAAGTLLGAYGLGSFHTAADLAFDAAGNLFGWESANGYGLMTIDKSTGAGTDFSAAFGSSGGGLDFDGSGTLWHAGHGLETVDTINTSTGAATHIADLSDMTHVFKAGKFDGSGVLWAVQDQGSHTGRLVTVDLAIGVITPGATLSVSDIDALVWA